MPTMPVNFQEKYILEPYRAIRDVYHQKHFDEKLFDQPLEEFSTLLSPKSVVLDIGCGTGGETKKLLKQEFDVTSVDISSEMLEKAQEVVPNGHFLPMDVLNLQFPDSSFAGVWSARTLIHVPSDQLDLAMRHIHRVLQPLGVLGLIVLQGTQEEVIPEYYDETGQTETFFKWFTKDELVELVTRHNFEIEKTEVLDPDEEEPHIFILARKE
jgi:ubiquinone/menaquinone biosynthesis C-methylase UbiE